MRNIHTKFTAEEFYPTPERLLEKVTAGLAWEKLHTVLDPSAGKGDMVNFVKERHYRRTWHKDLDVDCIEKDSDLRKTLEGQELRVIHDDFLTFHTYKRYDLIIMNPPFSAGASHLLKALDLQKDGGSIICILNAETIRNPYSNERKVLVSKLEDLGADIVYMENEFISSERPTGVEIAVIRVTIPEREFNSYIYDELQKKSYQENMYHETAELAPNDFIDAIVRMYNLEVESGIKLIQEYRAMCPHILDDLREDSTYKKPILTMKVGGHELSVNEYVREVRKKYWNALFRNPKFTGKMTSNLSSKYDSQVRELANYDFSLFNIKRIQMEISKNLISGIEECIIEMFDELSYQYHYSEELSKNIHYYNGWKTNKAWYINKKVILPYMQAFSSYSGRFKPDYRVSQKLMDIEKALNYLDGGMTDGHDSLAWLEYAKKNGQTKKIRLKYFYVTFYKKGTCHIEFINDELLKKLNIFGSQQKGWLPPGYGKKKYEEMEPEEQAVIDEFEGEEGYVSTMENTEYFIYNPKLTMPLLETSAAVGM